MQKKSGFGGGLVSSILLPLGLICLFAFCSLALALMGGTAYKSIQTNIDGEYDSIVAGNYLRTKVSQNNALGAVSVVRMEDVDVLVIRESEEGVEIETRVYFYAGQLMESRVAAGRSFTPGDGTPIASLADCSLQIRDGMFEARIVGENGGVTRMAVALVGGGL